MCSRLDYPILQIVFVERDGTVCCGGYAPFFNRTTALWRSCKGLPPRRDQRLCERSAWYVSIRVGV